MTSLRVADVSELPPGKGKVVELAGRQLTVYNLDGRLYAEATHRTNPAEPETGCPQHGLAFDVFAQDSPARLHAEEPCRVWVDGQDVWIETD
jgi:hypothetical protein